MRSAFRAAALPLLAAACLAACASAASGGAGSDYAEIAKLYEAQGNAAKAIELYRKALAQNAADRSARYSLAQLLLKQGGYQEAKPLLAGLLSEDPGNQSVAESLAYLDAKSGDFEAAWREYKAVLDITEGRESVLFNLVLLGGYLGKTGEAWGYAQRLLSLKPGEPAYLRLGTLAALADKRESEAEPLLSAYLLAKQKDDAAPVAFALELSAKGFHARALNILDGALAANPRNGAAWLAWSRVQALGAQDKAKARDGLAKALGAGFADQTALRDYVAALPAELRGDAVAAIKKALPTYEAEGPAAKAPGDGPALQNPAQPK